MLTLRDSNLELFRCLSNGCGKRPRLPPELIYQILASPSRWILLSSHSLSAPTSIGTGERIVVGTSPFDVTQIPLIREIVFTFTSKDQGWSSFPEDRGTFRNSWTWFEIGIVHDGKKKLTSKESDGGFSERIYYSQRNKHAWRDWESYCIRFNEDNELIADLEAGDAVVLWASKYSSFFPSVFLLLWIYHENMRQVERAVCHSRQVCRPMHKIADCG